MSKSQNTKNEQQKDLCITSEQLTEQWKKRTLRNGAFYIKMLGGDILPAFCNTEYILKQFQTMKGIYDDVAEVLAPVPSYEEYLCLTYAKEEDEKIIAEYEEENTKLKDLLKEIRGKINTIYDIDLNEFITSAAFSDDFVKKIDEVLNAK
jgi:hypothetical protein